MSRRKGIGGTHMKLAGREFCAVFFATARISLPDVR